MSYRDALRPGRRDILLPSGDEARMLGRALATGVLGGVAAAAVRSYLAGMTLANDSVKVSPDATGIDAAMHLPTGTKKYQVSMDSDAEGHVLGTIPTYFLYQEPRVTTAAATDLWDLHCGASATHSIRIMGLWALTTHSAASAFVTPWRFDCIRTSAAGTGGTAFSADAAAPATGVVSINRTDTSDPTLATLDAQITARSLPTAGATAETLFFPTSIFFEEGSTVQNLSEIFAQYFNMIPVTGMREFPRLRPGKGLKMRQITATASTGAPIGWLLMFGVI